MSTHFCLRADSLRVCTPFTILLSALALAWSPRLWSQNLGTTPTWAEAVAAYQSLRDRFPDQTHLREFGTSDVGRPLHVFSMGAEEDATLTLLVNNAIHPGEPCGVNACLDWATDMLQQGTLPSGVHIAIIPMYNIGGGLRRNCCTRANQNGPESYGFRGNARNLDLNRDFIKCDSRNALAFNALFAELSPDLFVDTHTSNGADYPATLTLIASQPDKLGGVLGPWLENTLLPELYRDMEAQGEAMTPYVHTLGSTPDDGIQDFLETPRYSTGYGALHHTIGFTTEAHMLKPFDDRVNATRLFLDVVLEAGIRHAAALRTLRNEQDALFRSAEHIDVAWTLDTASVDSLQFSGYAARYEWSPLTGKRRLRYDRDSTWTRNIRHLHRYAGTRSASVPPAFIVPQAWRHVLDRLTANGVEMTDVPRDTTLQLDVTHILQHSAGSRPYEGHHYRNIDAVEVRREDVQLFAGDKVISLDQPAARYLMETLSPQAVDAFAAWNFFDSALQQKEYFSAYVFEENAQDMIEEDAQLKREWEALRSQKKQEGSPMGHRAQLDLLYKASPHFEGTSDRYPVYAWPKGQPLPFR
ncbi:MAG: hypothetical protein CBC74_005320 [Crocinitomicaceae bacterium TMED114]|nr:MAG: hypothetical protein CBC74_005320 [Crocinitomicaceae bacterium TMED114]